MLLRNRTGQILIVSFLLCFANIFYGQAQTLDINQQIELAQKEFDNGRYKNAVGLARAALKKAESLKSGVLKLRCLKLMAVSQIALRNFEEAQLSLDQASGLISEKETDRYLKANLFLCYASLSRSKREYKKSFDYALKAIEQMPENRSVKAEHFFNTGRILFKNGYDISALIWLEKAQELVEQEAATPLKIEVYRFLNLAWASKLNYQKSIEYAEKSVQLAEKTPHKFLYRQALYELSTVLSAAGRKTSASNAMKKGLKLSLDENDRYHAGLFLTSLLLNSLYHNEVENASAYLRQFELINENDSFTFEIVLGKAVIAAFNNDAAASDELFSKLGKMSQNSDFILPYWKIIISERKKDWEKVIKFNQEVLEQTEKHNFRDGLPGIYLTFAKAYFQLREPQKALENVEKTIALVEELRRSENSQFSLDVFEIYHKAYRLLAQINLARAGEALELVDFLKARVLKDKINNSTSTTGTPIVSDELRRKLEELSLRFLENESVSAEIEKIEKTIAGKIPPLELNKPNLDDLDNTPELSDAAVVSYFFTLEGELLAFVREKGKPWRTVSLGVSEEESETLAAAVPQKIKSFIFFKRDGKELYDKLLKPLNLTAKHLVIIPDKALWKIPFQVLSADGEKYLIEEKTISYAPSVSILLEQLKEAKPLRQSLMAFANSTYDKRILQYVNREAASVAEIYNTKPRLNALVADFQNHSEEADILHFSMHAEVDNEQPLESFLAFKSSGKDDGRLTVEKLLKIKIKKKSLVFLASCDTNNVLNGEGIVSLAWAIMGSGATTVISAQWEANDKSTETFTARFYNYYKQKFSTAEAMQKASIDLIKNKSRNMHEPYYWGNFYLNGDFR